MSEANAIALEIVRLRDEEGRSFSAIGDKVGKSRDAVRRLYSKAASKALPEESRLEEWLRPIVKPAPPKRPCIYTPATCDIIAGDFHFPLASKPSVAVLLEAVKRLRPETVYLIGDVYDMMAISRFDKDYRQGFHFTLQDECDAGQNLLYLLEEIVQEFDGKIVMLLGNHEERYWKYINQMAPALASMTRAPELLSFKKWFIPEWSRCTISENDIIIYDDLTITHGSIVRSNGGASANAMAKKYFSSVVHGHTHRAGVSMIRVPSRGDRPEEVLRAYEIGCMADLQPAYAKKPDWTNAFAILMRDDVKRSWNIEIVPIINGIATVNTIGGTLQAI